MTPHVAAMSRPKDIAECFQQNLTRLLIEVTICHIDSFFSSFFFILLLFCFDRYDNSFYRYDDSFYRYDDGKEVGCQVDWRTLY